MRRFAHLSMWRRQAFPHVDPKQCVLAQGDVELEEVWLAQVKQRPPEDAWRNILTDTLTQLQLPAVYTAVLQHPRPWDRRQENKQDLFDEKKKKTTKKVFQRQGEWGISSALCENICSVYKVKSTYIIPQRRGYALMSVPCGLPKSSTLNQTLSFPLRSQYLCMTALATHAHFPSHFTC